MKTRTTLYADEGTIYTNGETYGTTIILAEGSTGFEWYKITQEEYEKIQREHEKIQEEMAQEQP